MATKTLIQHRRGTITELTGSTLSLAELGVSTGSYAGIGAQPLVHVGDGSTQGGFLVGRLMHGTTVPSETDVLQDLLFYDDTNKRFVRIDGTTNEILSLEGNTGGDSLYVEGGDGITGPGTIQLGNSGSVSIDYGTNFTMSAGQLILDEDVSLGTGVNGDSSITAATGTFGELDVASTGSFGYVSSDNGNFTELTASSFDVDEFSADTMNVTSENS